MALWQGKTGERDWRALREEMVRTQLGHRGIQDRKVLEAMARVPRHEFVPESARNMAYDDAPLPIGDGQTISQPYMVAMMTEALGLRGDEKVLEIGTGSGYQAAILAEMGCTVHTTEVIADLADAARERLERLGYHSVQVHHSDGTVGLPEESPFRGIIVTAGGPKVPESLKEQLSPDGGVLVIPVGDRFLQVLERVTRNGDEYRKEDLGGCRFVPLVGEHGW